MAVTTSVTDPRHDFEVNALGTFNLLESARRHAPGAAFLYASTNKVYGGLEHVGVEQRNGRYAFRDRPQGVSEAEPLDFHSPYGCSKGAADQYVRDYARIYGLRTVVFRQSCIYGWRQFGVEDQGWVAWFTIAAVTGKPVTIYGDGRQVRDLLFVDDLCDAYDAAVAAHRPSERPGLQPRRRPGATRCHCSSWSSSWNGSPAARSARPSPTGAPATSRSSSPTSPSPPRPSGGDRAPAWPRASRSSPAGSRKIEASSSEGPFPACGEGCTPQRRLLRGM